MDSLPRRGTLRSRALASASSRQSGVLRLKLMVLGSTSVGKSSILARFNADSLQAAEGAAQRRNGAVASTTAPLSSFSAASALGSVAAFSPGYAPTVGVSFVPAAVSTYRSSSTAKAAPLRVQSNFFDFSGEFSAYAKVRAEFLGDCSGIVICFDLTNKRSWEQVEEWYAEASSAVVAAASAAGQGIAGLHAIIVGCKSDLLDNAGSTRAVPESTVKAWCKSKGASYFECSAKTGLGVQKALGYLIEHANASGNPQAQPSPQQQQQQQPPPQQRPPSGSPHHSPQRSPPGASSSAGPSTANISDLSVGELRRECAKRGINTDDCLEKSEVLTKLREALARERASKVAEANESASRDERGKEAVLADVARWARGKDIRAMLNDIHGWIEGSSTNYLDRHASLAPVQIAYKKALLRIHPDKVDATEAHVHLRATEMFKTVNAAFEAFKKMNEKRSSGNPGAMEGASAAATAAAAAPAPSPTGSPTPRTRPAQGRR